jgi:hypothetical protein
MTMIPTPQPFVTDKKGRLFACSAVAVQAIIVDADECILLLSSPTRNCADEWQVISGSVEAAETLLEKDQPAVPLQPELDP